MTIDYKMSGTGVSRKLLLCLNRMLKMDVHVFR